MHQPETELLTMRITSVKYRTNVEVAPYRHEHCEVEVYLHQGDTAEDAFEQAKSTVRALLGIDIDEEDVAFAKEILAKAARLNPKAR